jgi:hypothetical protein
MPVTHESFCSPRPSASASPYTVYNTEQGHRGDEVAHQPASNFTTWPKPLLSTTYTLPAPSTATSSGP